MVCDKIYLTFVMDKPVKTEASLSLTQKIVGNFNNWSS